MHGSAARGIAIPFAPSSLLPCPPPRSRSFARSLACSQTLRASSHLFQPSSLAIPVILLAVQVSILAFSLFLSLPLSHPSLSLSLSLFFHFCVSLSFTFTASTQACRHAYTRGESGPHCEPKTKFSATSPPSMFPIMRC